MKICSNTFSSKKAIQYLINKHAELCLDYRNNESWVYLNQKERKIPFNMAYEMIHMMFYNAQIFELDSGNTETGMEYYRFNYDVIKIANEHSYLNHLKTSLMQLIQKYDSSNTDISKADIIWLSKKRRRT